MMENKKRSFAFIVHLRSIEDIAHTIPFVPKWVVTKILKWPILWLMWYLRGRMGFMVRSTFPVTDDVQGHILVVWLTGQQMVTPNHNGHVKRRILEAILYAQNKLGCEFVGLGALTASVTHAGKCIANHPDVKCAITHGDHHAAGLAIEGIKRVAEKRFDRDLSELTVDVVGATGIIGDALTRALVSVTGKLILTGRKKNKLAQYASLSNVKISDDIADAKEADIVVTATSSPDALIKSEHLKYGAVVYEVSQPRNVSQHVTKEREDILVVDGSYARVPEGVKFWWMSLPPQHTFGCMAETVIQCLEGDREHHVGGIDLGFMEEVERRAAKYGYGLAPFTSFNKEVVIEPLVRPHELALKE